MGEHRCQIGRPLAQGKTCRKFQNVLKFKKFDFFNEFKPEQGPNNTHAKFSFSGAHKPGHAASPLSIHATTH
jgi:hypothetical protein